MAVFIVRSMAWAGCGPGIWPSERGALPAYVMLPMTRTAAFARIEARIGDAACVFTVHGKREMSMNDETLNMSIRKLLKSFGIAAQREIEQAVAKAAASGDVKGYETLPATITLEVAGLKLKVAFGGDVVLE